MTHLPSTPDNQEKSLLHRIEQDPCGLCDFATQCVINVQRRKLYQSFTQTCAEKGEHMESLSSCINDIPDVERYFGVFLEHGLQTYPFQEQTAYIRSMMQELLSHYRNYQKREPASEALIGFLRGTIYAEFTEHMRKEMSKEQVSDLLINMQANLSMFPYILLRKS